jgi:hypothetical protein
VARQCTKAPNGTAQDGQDPRTAEMPRNLKFTPMEASSWRWSGSKSTKMSSGLSAGSCAHVADWPGSGEWYLYFVYQVSSDYGQSIALPLFWLFVLFATGVAVFYAMHATLSTTALSLEAIPHAAALSFANLIRLD